MSNLIIESVIGTAVPVLGDDIDTDRIVPARFLKEISFDKMGDYLFIDERVDTEGESKNFIIDQPDYENATIMVVGKNFGCGSSREHAPQAIKRFGIKAIIGESFAEIFAGNCKAIGIPVVCASKHDIEKLLQRIDVNPKTQVTVNLVSKRIQFFEDSFAIQLPAPQRESFLKGTWDVLALLKERSDLVQELSDRLIY
ncbi:3-isopropylmalate dehydratase small subunit [Candidatus Marinamargulisbacteria bacterium SCGC AG-414-C22]|nr:3-isopropylmalate dehydratase small subunit [Candidatus Marinamargulisbacteria bacterium SCGC AG-414-C22]